MLQAIAASEENKGFLIELIKQITSTGKKLKKVFREKK